MKKRKKEVRAGNLVYAVISTPPMPRDPEHVRAAKSKMSTQARRALNMKAAYRRLEMLLAANFIPKDLHLTLTYRDSDLPGTRAEAVKRVRKFLAQMRKLRNARGEVFKYIYVTEGKHTGKRFHHHIVINATKRDIDDIRALWPYGDQVDIEPIADRARRAQAGQRNTSSITADIVRLGRAADRVQGLLKVHKDALFSGLNPCISLEYSIEKHARTG